MALTYSVIGLWRPVAAQYITATNNGLLGNDYWAAIELGAGHAPGIVLGGWSHNTGPENRPITPTDIAILGLGPDNRMTLVTSQYTNSPATNGMGSVNVADFNGDGFDDIFLAGWSEHPYTEVASAVFLSSGPQGFSKFTFPDAVAAHDAIVADVEGFPVLYTKTSNRDGKSPYYTYTPSGFTTKDSGYSAADALAVADLDGDGKLEMVLGDFLYGPGVAYSPDNKTKIAIYPLQDGAMGSEPLAILHQYFPGHDDYKDLSSFRGPGNSHTFRLRVDDFNHDGLPDLLGLESLWNGVNNEFPSVIQMLQNEGGLAFRDVTDRLNPDYDRFGDEADYSFAMLDVDGSGIKTYFSAGKPGAPADRHSGYVLLNDGTGRLHVAVHDEFVGWGAQAKQQGLAAYSNYSDPASGTVWQNQGTPKFIPYVVDGKINFVAVIDGAYAKDGWDAHQYVLVDVAAGYDITTDFAEDIAITDRNGSRLIRTFAGDDTISSTNGAGTCSINAGLGFDTLVYVGARRDFDLSVAGGALVIAATKGDEGIDTVVNAETLRFADMSVNLTIGDDAALVSASHLKLLEELYVAFFNRVPEADGLAFWIRTLAGGETIDSIADAFYAAAVQFSTLTGYTASMTDADFVKVIYANVLGREGPTAPPDADVQFWASALAEGRATKGSLVVAMLDSAHSFKGDATWGWVPDLLDNKAAVANYFAVSRGLGYNSAQESIAKGMAIAAAVTATDTSAAVALIGVSDDPNVLG